MKLLSLLPFLPLAFIAGVASAEPITYAVSSLEATWHDASRDRDVPVKIYYPSVNHAPAPGRFPVIIFSHGLGGTREGYGYLGEGWAAHGYVSVHVQHLGSDDQAYKHTLRPLRKMVRELKDPSNQVNRPQDIHFAIDRIVALSNDPAFPLHDHLDVSEIGVAGHSFGAYTTMAIAGEAYREDTGKALSSPDPRVKAAIAMSIPIPREGMDAETFDRVRVPVFHMTGTEDTVAFLGDQSAGTRRLPYDRTTHATAYLLIFKGGDHMTFSGRVRNRQKPTDPLFHALIIKASDAYWDAYLKHDATALTWLEKGGFASELGAHGTFEEKHPAGK